MNGKYQIVLEVEVDPSIIQVQECNTVEDYIRNEICWAKDSFENMKFVSITELK